MKKHWSVFGLFARSSFFGIFAVLVLMCGAEVLLFGSKLREAVEAYNGGLGFAQPESLISQSGITLCFACAFCLVTLLLILPGTEIGSRSGYTWRRLLLTERQIFCHQAAYNICMYLLLLATQILLAFGLCKLYVSSCPADLLHGQITHLAFYRNDFLHSLLPLGEITLWIRNGVLTVTLGLAAAQFPFKQRRKHWGVTILALLLFTLWLFIRGIGNFFNTGLMIAVCIVALMEILYSIFKKEDVDEA